ncbi:MULTISPECIES: DNA-binding protein [Thermosphaera]|jgi:programmed cell death protein 5|uniref:DNA-binding protein Tagg_0930 n=2 Tax=Thermosphaera TaxID=54253 RepID=D5U252_THEAM|nr:DNA-binding protein [Thermosphaera aggregans]ADG91202.1 DNA-binding TFAR19-related protein [Thermosphaera aggregans DSM 11486]QOR94793.1 DNA-binding protein [Thermosphaera aggregans]
MEDYGYSDEELEAIRQRKMMELKKRMEEEQARRAQIEAVMRKLLTPEARERLNNIRLVKPELAEALEQQIIALAQAGRIPVPVTDEFLKKILSELYEHSRRETRITFKRK